MDEGNATQMRRAADEETIQGKDPPRLSG